MAGIAGPAAFTAAWIVASLRQTGYPAAEIQLSGLAAADARDPWIMITGFVVLGGCSVAFGTALHDALGRRGVPSELGAMGWRGVLGGRRALGGALGAGPDILGAGSAPRLIQGAGLLTVAAGLLRRDHMLLISGSVSWHNHAHDVVSAVIYADLVLAQVLLAHRFGRDCSWRRWRLGLAASAAATAGLLIAFAADTSAANAGILQRAAVTVPLAAMTAVAARLLMLPGRDG